MESLNLIPALGLTPSQVGYASAVAAPSTGPWLTLLVVFPALVALLIWAVPTLRERGRVVALWASIAEAAALLGLALTFDWGASSTTQFLESYQWITQLGITWSLGVNALGLVMLLLTALLVPLVLLAAKSEDEDTKRGGAYAALILVLYSFIVMIFTAYDLVVFYIAFEAMLLPLFFMISRFGITENRRAAAMKFLLYSLAGGLIMLGSLVVIEALGGGGSNPMLFRYDALQETLPLLSSGWQMAIFLPLFIAFAIKAPMVPVHTWLPDTAEAARPGTSTLLVGILDKVGTYGMIVMVISFLPAASTSVRPFILVLAVISVLWGGFAANGQKNLLRLVSFTSVSHFGFIVLGIFIGSEMALTGAMVYMVAHGFSIAALFLISGFLIERGEDANISAYSGLQRVTPVLAGTWLFAGLASIALPGLSGFVPEYLVLMGTYKVNIALAIFAVFGVILAAMYILLPYQKMFTGRINPEQADMKDLNGRERLVVAPLVVGMAVLGIWSAPLVGSMNQISEHLAPNIAFAGETQGELSGAPALAPVTLELNEGNAQ